MWDIANISLINPHKAFMNIKKILFWGLGGILIGIVTFFVPIPGGARITFWPLLIATSLTGNPKAFVIVGGFIALPNFLGVTILIVGWFLLGIIVGMIYSKLKKKPIA